MTTETPEATRRLRCALFVDFDNVYLGLQRLDPAAAEAFAGSPGHWLSALESGLDEDGEFTRRFLVRACYLNPSAFSQFRPNFTRAGFSVVDCPSLTQQGKSSADINLVLDAVDALAAETRYDEFVILSADADFTPLVLRCRAADRRVTVVTAGPAASAYKSVADTVVTADQFTELVLGTDEAATDFADLREVPAGDPAPGTTTSGSKRGSTASGTPAAKATASPTRSGSRRATDAGTAKSATPTPAAAPAEPPTSTGPTSNPAARRAVLRRVRGADRPLKGGEVANVAHKADPSLPTSDWQGSGGFFAWLSAAVPELRWATKPAPGFVWDPKRFSETDLPGLEPVDLPPLQRQVVDVTEIPNLPADLYRTLLDTLAKDIRTTPFDRPETARRVRDACQATGATIGRASVNTVISGLLYAGLDLAAKPTATVIAETWADNVIGLCRGARMDLRPQDVVAIRSWVSGGILSA
ncbi:NYN domain-containing protein [Actinotalea sp.]|uniref:NYN domain-containing protein n=1 Tax=Actinotalea sp. TaxID=1872145 RepID=UPI003565064B